MNYDELKKILHAHREWRLTGGKEGERADLRGAHLAGADLRSANLAGANLAGANLDGACLTGANLVSAELDGANLAGSSLTCANLADAYITCANLADANLSGANLSGANLRRANLRRENLYGANLDGANLADVDLAEAADAPPYFSISWGGHGARGRRLHAVERDGELVFSCGCFSGSESDLREYIDVGYARCRASRTRALEIILELAAMEGAK